MLQTTHYNMTKGEGTDTVNLLTQCYPNFDTIDAQMWANANASTSTAVETKSGTVHQLVRTNSNCAMFRFVATSNYTAGDTFTVDGVAVTTTAVNGTSLPTGAFVINTNVLCCLTGTQMTIYVAGNTDDVDAGDVSYDNTESGLDATDVQIAIDELAEDVNEVNSNLTANEINVPTSTWVTDSTSSDYGYKATISSALYSNNFVPQYVDLIPYDGSAFFSEGENEAKGILNPNIVINASGVTFYASAIPTVALKFRIGGQA